MTLVLQVIQKRVEYGLNFKEIYSIARKANNKKIKISLLFATNSEKCSGKVRAAGRFIRWNLGPVI